MTELTVQDHAGRGELFTSAFTNWRRQSSILDHIPVGDCVVIQGPRSCLIRGWVAVGTRHGDVACCSAPVVASNLSSERAVDGSRHPARNIAWLQGIWLQLARAEMRGRASWRRAVGVVHVHIHIHVMHAVPVDHLGGVAKGVLVGDDAGTRTKAKIGEYGVLVS